MSGLTFADRLTSSTGVPTSTGRPHAAASRNTIPNASGSRPSRRVRHGIAKTSPASKYFGICCHGTPPVKITESETPRLSASRMSLAHIRALTHEEKSSHPALLKNRSANSGSGCPVPCA